MIVALTLATLAVVVVAALAGGTASTAHLSRSPASDLRGILQSAGLLFFAFAGYARIATLGEEVVDPRRTIPRAIPLALGIVLVVYVVVGVSALLAVGADGLAATAAPLRAVVEAGSLAALSPVVQVGAAVASLGALLALILGVSRTTLGDGARPRAARRSSPRSTPGTACRTAPSSRSRPSWSCSSPPSTCAGRSASRRSACSPTTRSPTRQRAAPGTRRGPTAARGRGARAGRLRGARRDPAARVGARRRGRRARRGGRVGAAPGTRPHPRGVSAVASGQAVAQQIVDGGA